MDMEKQKVEMGEKMSAMQSKNNDLEEQNKKLREE